MQRRGRPPLWYLDAFGLDRRALLHLGDRRVRVSVHLRHPYSDKGVVRRWLRLSPAERVARRDVLSRQRYERACAAAPFYDIERSGGTRSPLGFIASIAARDLARLGRTPEIETLYVSEVAGRKKRALRKHPLTWFAVRGRVAIQVEGQRRGLQTVEDRMMIVRAHTHADARARLEKGWRQYATPYFNMAGQLVRWQLEEIVGSYEMEETIDPRGTEAWSLFESRRMRPDRVWLPSRRKTARHSSSRPTRR